MRSAIKLSEVLLSQIPWTITTGLKAVDSDNWNRKTLVTTIKILPIAIVKEFWISLFQNSITSSAKLSTKVNNKRWQCCDRSDWRLRDDCHTVRSLYSAPSSVLIRHIVHSIRDAGNGWQRAPRCVIKLVLVYSANHVFKRVHFLLYEIIE